MARGSLEAGFCGAAASAFWFSALALAPAEQKCGRSGSSNCRSPPRSAGGCSKRLTVRQVVGGIITALGVVVTALG